MEKKEKDALEVGPKADAAEDAQNQAEDRRVVLDEVFPEVVGKFGWFDPLKSQSFVNRVRA